MAIGSSPKLCDGYFLVTDKKITITWLIAHRPYFLHLISDHRKPRKILAHPLVDMNREQTIRLIQRYGEQRLLWDKKDPKHLNIEHRRESWTRIANEYKWPIGVLKKKIASLLGSHRRELHRERKSRIRGG